MVIAVIGLLIAILVPALRMAKRQANAVVCRSNLKQWGLLFNIYADNNDSYMPGDSFEWANVLRSDYDAADGLSLCPRAKKTLDQGGRQPFAAYDNYALALGSGSETARGSYGINGWVCNPASGMTTNPLGLPTANNFRKINVPNAGNIPLLLDSMWVDSYPDNTNDPPESDGDFYTSGPMGSRQMRFFCISRHDGYVNTLFLDSSVRKTGLKELWKLNWHRNSESNAPTPDWPDWMKKYKDY